MNIGFVIAIQHNKTIYFIDLGDSFDFLLSYYAFICFDLKGLDCHDSANRRISQ